jgi:hypothetical protein
MQAVQYTNKYEGIWTKWHASWEYAMQNDMEWDKMERVKRKLPQMQ